MGRGCPVLWRTRSFFEKEKVYQIESTTKEDMKNRIRAAFQTGIALVIIVTLFYYTQLNLVYLVHCIIKCFFLLLLLNYLSIKFVLK